MKRNLLNYFRGYLYGFLTFFALGFQLFSMNLFAQSNGLNFNNTGTPAFFPAGTGDYATIGGGNIISTGSYTKEAWIRIADASGPGTGARNILSETNSSFFVYDNGQLAAGQKPSWTARVIDPTPLTVGVWYHVGLTFDATTNQMVLYKNGVPVASLTNSAMAMAPADLAPSNLGAIYVSSKYGFGFWGDMAEVRVWDYARSSAEMLLTYKCGIPLPTDGLIAYYKFDEGIPGGNNTSITTLTDATGNGHTATLHGFILNNGTTSNFIGDFNELTGTCSVVPVSLSGLIAKSENNSVVVSWQTFTESNNRGFAVERSVDGISNWQQIGFVQGNGNSSITRNYNYVDVRPKSGVNYYRLVQTDFDGHSAFSKIVSAVISKTAAVSIYPTVATTSIRVNISNETLLKTPFAIFDNTGRVVQKGLIQSLSETIDISQLNSGVYYLKLQNNNGMKFMKR